ncbi:MAG TPA: hypothetical protein VF175_19700, partial [Lacipirellula sp.]
NISDDAWLVIADALSAGRRKLSPTQVAVVLAKLAKDTAARFGINLRNCEIKKAFDAAAQREGKTCQESWPDGLDAARKAINRATAFEGLPPIPDKESLEVVRTLCDRFS